MQIGYYINKLNPKIKHGGEIMLNNVMTLSEAALLWGVDQSSIRTIINENIHGCSKKRLKEKKCEIITLDKDFGKSGAAWLITYSAMEKLYGPIKK